MPIDRPFVLATLCDLVRIDSRNPDLEAGGPGERELAEHVATLLQGLGWEPSLRDLGGNRANVLATRRGTGGGPSLMINVHLDTVGVAGMSDPFAAEVRDGRVYGRGSQDTKGGLAAVLGAVRALAESKTQLCGDLVLAFVADEEGSSRGTEAVVAEIRTDAGIVLEPSELDVVVAHRGFGLFRLETRGRTAHGGLPDVGRDANTHMAHCLVELDRLHSTWRSTSPHALLGTPSMHVPLVAGGRQRFIYADSCTAEIECRTVPGQTLEGVRAELEQALAAAKERVPQLETRLELVQWRSPHEIDPSRPIVATLLAETTAVRGRPAGLKGHGWWEDSALLAEAGIDTVVMGPLGSGLHTEEEWVDIESVLALAEILRRTILSHCGISTTRTHNP